MTPVRKFSKFTMLLKSRNLMFYPQKPKKIMKRKPISKRKKNKNMATTTPTPTPSTTTSQLIPDDIIFFHILPKLPVRCLLRFTCVSNLWYTTIHHPNFIASHFTHAKSNPSLLAICVQARSYYINFLHLEKKEEEEEEEEGKGGEHHHHHHHHPIYNNNNASVDFLLAHVFVIGSCNGITCSILSDIFQITNPSTRELLVIRRPKRSKAALTICRGGESNGFGFDPLMNEYKIIQNYVDCSGYYECWVYTLGSNLWRNITTTCNNCLSYCAPLDMQPICISGALFWRTSSHLGILSFDLHHEKFQYILCPQVSEAGSMCYTLFEMEGRPCLAYRHDKFIKDEVHLTLYTLTDHHHLNGMCTKQQQQQHKASSCCGSWINLGYDIRIPKKPGTERIRVITFYKQIYLQWDTKDGDFMLCNVNKLEIQNKCSATYRFMYVFLVNHVENLLSLETFVPPSADFNEIRYVSSREAIHESPTTNTSCSSKDRQRQEMLRERKRNRFLNNGCLTIPRWVSR